MEMFSNFATAYRHALPSFKEQPAISIGDQMVLDHMELAERSARIAAGLATRRLEPGDRVAVVMQGGIEFYPMLLAIWHAGLTAVPIAPTRSPEEIAWILHDSGTKLCVVEDRLRAPVEAVLAADGFRPLLVGSSVVAQLEGHPPLLPRPCPGGPDGVALLQYTWGTTGRPKGVMHSHANLAALILGYLEQVDSPRPGDSIIHVEPLNRTSGLAGLAHLLCGANQVIPRTVRRIELDEILTLTERWPNSTIVLPPAIVMQLAYRAASQPERVASLRTIVYDGPIGRRDAKRALAVFGPKLVALYGLGEAPMSVLLGRDEHLELTLAKRSTPLPVGRARAGVELRVVGIRGQELAAGELGEVLLRGPSVMQGYWNAPGATATALRGGWLHTGDLGWRDEHGHLGIVGRVRDAIQSPRGPLYPHAIEQHLLRNPAIRELAIVGRATTARSDEEEPIAFVCREAGANVSIDDLLEHCRALAEHERPAAFIFIDALPRNGSGTVLRRVLRSRVTTRSPVKLDSPTALMACGHV